MDPQTDLPDLVEDLEVNIDELSATLEPLLSTPLHTTASSLPLLDKTKLYVLAAYSIESLLFSTLKASGLNATEHPVFTEIARLKGYFGKIKEIEDRGIKGSAEGRARLDVGAAQRFIKHGLSGNEKYDLERRERMAKEKARAHLKAQKINKKFDDEGNEMQSEGVTPKKRGVDEVDAQEEVEDEEVLEEAEPATKKARVSVAEHMDVDSAPSSSVTKKDKNKKAKQSAESTDAEEKDEDDSPDTTENPSAEPSSATTKKDKKQMSKKSKASADTISSNPEEEDDTMDLSVAAGEPEPEADTPQPKKRGRPPKKDKKKAKQSADSTDAETQAADTDATPSRLEARVMRKRNRRLSNQNDNAEVDEEALVPTPDRAPKTRSETFNALLDGSLGEKQKKTKAAARGGRGRGRGRGK
ncbi:hypothetical protein EJ02DRAFT_449812 [Clathrospora elynae]|uniref:Exosome complex protein n=1 Tax=Clathrospora elynae TaxID=706981 RepID=A0A6A5T4W2_9PLEO|nr:hypothetical protein EJ02DRAFT_449812 [Clathrospora elynae]